MLMPSRAIRPADHRESSRIKSIRGLLIRLISDDLFELAAIGPIERPRCAGRVRGSRRTIVHSLPFLGATLALWVGFGPCVVLLNL